MINRSKKNKGGRFVHVWSEREVLKIVGKWCSERLSGDDVEISEHRSGDKRPNV